ncbi:MAG: LOW QUALITY PROTEIN: hypothetical protein BJ554DRAFT_3588 [Olpidium bornovanus]|uniref:Uncharacterized protein n=1 Tax=Olpidium bornovanus TaxID=278681 RepID=A0A8H8A0J8_9FUNG|nr:MAG: LOW QUALITY PROTEIN: hypothetical protein BJ554DRAFT_3588 [Olpidium bornovanus]
MDICLSQRLASNPRIPNNHHRQQEGSLTQRRKQFAPGSTVGLTATDTSSCLAFAQRGIDVHDAATGSLLALLRDPDNISAVPAVVCSHASDLMIAGGNASGKVVVFS